MARWDCRGLAACILFPLVLLSACSWVDDTGRSENTAPDIALDEVNLLREGMSIQWPLRLFDADNDIVSLKFELVAAGQDVLGCAAEFSAVELAPTLREACQPLLSDQQCEINFNIAGDEVHFDIPALRRPAALQYSVQVIDEEGAIDSRSIDLCVASVSESPTANADEYTVAYLDDLAATGTRFDDACVAQGGTGVLANDIDDFDYREGWDSGQMCLRAELVQAPRYAEYFEFNTDGGFTYQSSGAAGPGATDYFEYKVTDGLADSDQIAVATIQITGTNTPPRALDPVLQTLEDQSLQITPSQLALDPEGTHLRIESFEQPLNGTLQLVNGNLRFVPETNFTGETQLEVIVADAAGVTVNSKAKLRVAEVNDAPLFVGLPETLELLVEDPRAPGMFTWFFNVTDEETPASELQVSVLLDNAVVTGQVIGPNSDGEVELQLWPVHSGESTVVVQVQDRVVNTLAAQSNERPIPVKVIGMNLSPDAEDDSESMFKNENADIEVLNNDRDPDGDDSSLKIHAILEHPRHGSASIRGDGLVINYVPDTGFSGVDQLIYQVLDSDQASAQARLTLSVLNREPVAVNDNHQMYDFGNVLVDVLANDSDPDGDSLSVSLGEGQFLGEVLVVDDRIRYTPRGGYYGVDVVPYTVSDGDGGYGEAELVIQIRSQGSDR